MVTKVYMLILIILQSTTVMCQYVNTIAGSGSASYNDGQGLSASFNFPIGIAVDSQGNVFVCDETNNAIRKINRTGYVSTVAGSGISGSSDGQGVAATFNHPQGIAVDSYGNMYVTDANNNRIRKISSTGYVTTVAGQSQGQADGQGVAAGFNSPFGIAIDLAGNLFVSDSTNNRIRKVSLSGYVSTVAGSGQGYNDGQGANASFYYPMGITVDLIGNLYVADSYNQRIRKINSTWYVSTIAGSIQGFSDGQGPSSKFKYPFGIAIDLIGNLYIADTSNGAIRKMDSSGYVSTFVPNVAVGISANLYHPEALTVDSFGNVFVSDTANNLIKKISFTTTSSGAFSSSGITSTNSLANTFAFSSSATSIPTFVGSNIATSSSSSNIMTSLSSSNIMTSLSSSNIMTSLSSSNIMTSSSTNILSIPTSIASSSTAFSTTLISISSINSQSIPFYLKAEFIYSSFVGFIGVTFVMVYYLKIGTRIVLVKRMIEPPSEVMRRYARR